MTYGTIKVDTITFTDGGVDKSVSVSGLVENPTFTGNVTATGTISGNTVRGQTISGVTVTGTTAQFTSGTFTSLTGVTVTGTTANFTSGNFTNISGGTHTITSGVFALGTAANPSISFVSDPNSGLYSPGADQVAISTNGTGRLFVDASGRILAGASSARVNFFNTTSLSASLQIEGVTSSSHYVSFISSNSTGNEPACLILGHQKSGSIGGNTLLGSGDATGRISFQGSDGAQFVEAAAISCDIDGTPSGDDMPGRLVFATTADGAASPTERMRLDSSGRLGVGTSSPQRPLDVNGSVRLSSGSVIEFGGTVTNFITGDNSSNYLAFGTNSSERARIDSSGRLGLGTSSPSFGLDVIGTSRVSGSARFDNGLQLKTATQNYIYFDDALSLTRNGVGDRLTIDSSGRVGIGTTSPVYTLDCRGTFYAAVASGSNNITLGDTSNGTQSTIRTSNSNLIFSANASTESFRVDSSSRLLVGTSTGSELLRVAGQVQIGNGTAGGGGGGMYRTTGFTASGSSHTIPYVTWAPNGTALSDTFSGMLIVTARKTSGYPTGVAVSILAVTKREASSTSLTEISNKKDNITTFAVTNSGNDISVSTDSGCVVCVNFIGGIG